MEDKLEERLNELKDQYSKTKYNKSTNKYLGILRAKMAKVNKEMKNRKRKKGLGFAVKKVGDATVALVGFPNAGKSSLLGILTNAESKVADYAFTTVGIIPGILEYEGAKIQMLDTPGLIEGAHLGKGGGAKISSVIRSADLVLFVVDVTSYEKLFGLINELSELGILFREANDKVRVEEQLTGGIRIFRALGAKGPDDDSIKEIMKEMAIFNASIMIFDDYTYEDIINAFSESKIFIKGLIALNKIDLVKDATSVKRIIEERTKIPVIPLSAKSYSGIDSLREGIFKNLNLMRIYLKEKKESPDIEKPLIIKNGSTVYEAAFKIHSDIAKNMKSAYVTGSSVKFKNQRVGKNHVLKDKDIITIE
jgi:ribosome-interacting GTPase 1